jgi:hypothetical protein
MNNLMTPELKSNKSENNASDDKNLKIFIIFVNLNNLYNLEIRKKRNICKFPL